MDALRLVLLVDAFNARRIRIGNWAILATEDKQQCLGFERKELDRSAFDVRPSRLAENFRPISGHFAIFRPFGDGS